MKIDSEIRRILNRAYDGISPNKGECRALLGVHEASAEAFAIRGAGAILMREVTGNSALINGQIGVESGPCIADCGFCSFGESHTVVEPSRIDPGSLEERVHAFTKGNDLFGIYLMAMHTYNLDFFLDVVRCVRRTAPENVRIFSNVGDTDRDAFIEMKKAGVDGVYHVNRLGEGVYTRLDPRDRLKTIDNARAAGLQLLDCLEPIGPEHTSEVLTDRMFEMLGRGCSHIGAMRRIAVPGTPLEHAGQITELRLAQIGAVLALAAFTLKPVPALGIHEPNPIGFVSGGNRACAETGANPRDCSAETSDSRGMDVDRCRRMLYEAGFGYLRRGDGSTVELTADYIEAAASVE